MRRTTYTGTFFLCLLFNMMLNFRLTIPAWILLILHFVLGISTWWFVGAMGAFVLFVFFWMLVIRLASRAAASAKDAPPVENKNPYSSKGYVPIKQRKGGAETSLEDEGNKTTK